MQNNTSESRACQGQSGEKTPTPVKITGKAIHPLHPEILEGDDIAEYEVSPFVEEVGRKPVVTPVIKVIDACILPNETPAKKKNIEESRRLLDTFKEKLGSYPKVLTYEGAVVLCVMLSVNEGEPINLNGMPMEDKALILSLLPPTLTAHLLRCDATLKVEFDEAKDFVLTY